MATLKTILSDIKKDLVSKNKIQEGLHERMRKVTSLSKRAILLAHQKRLKEAEKLLQEAKENVSVIREISKSHPDIVFGGMFSAALQEYSEANIFLKLVEETRFITPEEVNVSSLDYVLGLADVVGECRRIVLDKLRQGQLEEAEEYLRTMDEIYVELMAIDEAYMLVPGLRRKCDVARRIIETTRGDITQEAGKKALENRLAHFEELISASEKRYRNRSKTLLSNKNR
jgi:translin